MNYLFLEFTALVDNLAKNMFFTCFDTTVEHLYDTDGNEQPMSYFIDSDGTVRADEIDWEKVNDEGEREFCIWEPTLYDLDSCYMAENTGKLSVPYYADWDYTDSVGTPLFNGYGSRLWLPFEVAFESEIKTMAQYLASNNLMTYDKFYNVHIVNNAEIMCASVVNRDMNYKYNDAWTKGYIDYSQESQSTIYTSQYKYLHRGQRTEQKQAYIYNRSHMWYSKYQTNQFIGHDQDNINFRAGTNISAEDSSIDVTASICLYLGILYGDSGTVVYTNGKIMPNTTTTITGSGVGSSDHIYICGGSDLTDIGDISKFVPYDFSLSNAGKLKRLIIGNENIVNAQLVSSQIAGISNCTLLQILNVQNCTSLSSLDLSSNGLIQEVYAQGSATATITLPEGGNLTTIYYPSAITSIKILDHKKLETFSCEGYDNLKLLWIENTPNVPVEDILLGYLSKLSRGVRLVGVEWDFTGIAEGSTYYGKPELLQRLISNDAYGKYISSSGDLNNKAYPTISGTVTIDYINHTLYEELQSLYPNLVIQTASGGTPIFTYTVTFLDGDGNEISVQEVRQGGIATDPISLGIIPTKLSTVQYVYTLASSSWDISEWRVGVTKDLTVNAQFLATLQVYDVAFYKNSFSSTALNTQTSITYGEAISYGGEVLSSDTEIFVGWTSKSTDTKYIFNSITLDEGCCTIDSDGNPETVIFYANFEKVEMPTLSETITDLTSLTYGELKAVANMIRDGSDGTWTVSDAYYGDGYYSITNANTKRQIIVSLNSQLPVDLSDGTTVGFYICDLNHDVDEDGNLIGITFGMYDLYTGTTIDSSGYGYRRNINPSYKQCYDFRIGNGKGTVSTGSDSYTGTDGYTHYINDNNDYTSTTDITNSVVYTPSSAEYTAGYAELEFSGRTFLRSIVVTTSTGADTTWYFDYNGYYAGNGNKIESVDNISWYLPDTTSSTYKIGRLFYDVNGSTADAATLTSGTYTSDNFGGMTVIIGDNGQITHYYYVTADNFQYASCDEITDGVIFKIPVSSGDTVTINPWTYSRNVGGYERTAYREWVNDTFVEMLPLGLRNIITPAAKQTGIGNRSTTVSTTVDSVWAFSGKEVGVISSTNSIYGDEGTLYPVFSTADSRIRKYSQGEGISYTWWLRSPFTPSGNGVYSFLYVNPEGGGSSYHASSTYAVVLGLCI